MRFLKFPLGLLGLLAILPQLGHSQEPLLIPAVPTSPLAQEVYGEPNCCAHCRKVSPCQKQTRVVREMKKVTRHTFEVQCDQVCSLKPTAWFGFSWLHAALGTACGQEAADCGEPLPEAGHCRTRKTLVRKEYVVEVPVYKCVVEYHCVPCGEAIGPDPRSASTSGDNANQVPRVARLPQSSSGYGE